MLKHCPIRIAIGRFDDSKHTWTYERISSAWSGPSVANNDFDAMLSSPNRSRLGQAVQFLTSLGYTGFDEILAEHYAVEHMNLEHVEDDSPAEPAERHLAPAQGHISDEDDLFHEKEQDRPSMAQGSAPAITQVTKARKFIVISSSDHEEPSQSAAKNIKNERAAGPRHEGGVSSIRGIKRKRNPVHQRVRSEKDGVQPHRKISKPNSGSRQRVMKGRQPTPVPSTSAFADPAIKRARVSGIIDLCSTDSENVSP